MAHIDCRAQEVVEFGGRERVPGAEKGYLAARPERRTAMITSLTPRMSGRGGGAEWSAPLEARHSSLDRADRFKTPIRSNPTTMDRPAIPLSCRGHHPWLNRRHGASCLVTGEVAIAAMRTKVVSPTNIAPTIANASRKVVEGTPIWVKASVAW